MTGDVTGGVMVDRPLDTTAAPPTDFGSQIAWKGGLPEDWDIKVSETTELVVEEDGAFRVMAFGAALFASGLLGYVIAWRLT